MLLKRKEVVRIVRYLESLAEVYRGSLSHATKKKAVRELDYELATLLQFQKKFVDSLVKEEPDADVTLCECEFEQACRVCNPNLKTNPPDALDEEE